MLQDLSLPDSMLLHLFCSGLDIEAALYLDKTIGGSFIHKTTTKQKKILAHIIEKHTSSVIRTKPLQAKVMSSVEESSLAESKPLPSVDLSHEPSPKPQTLKERLIHPLEFPIKFGDYGNISKYYGHEKLSRPSEQVSYKIEPLKE